MASNIFARYVWLIDTIRRRKRITFEQINEEWISCGLGYGDGLAKRTFHDHKKSIEEIFNVCIECDSKNRYYISNPETLANDSLRSWLIDSYATLNQLQADSHLEGRIMFEDIPSGQEYLSQIIQTMRKNLTITIDYKGFGKDRDYRFNVEPYCVKVFNRRWYLIAHNPYYDKVMIYALDRMQSIEETKTKFLMPEDFDINDFFKGCYGIIADKNIPIERIVIRAYKPNCAYLSTLPLHSSQREVKRDEDSITFEYHIRPTFDFYQALLAQANLVEVLEPESVRKKLLEFAGNIEHYYK